MKNDDDMGLYRLFGELPEPVQDEIFIERVTRRMARYRWAQRVVFILLAFAGAAILAMLTPWLTVLTRHIAIGTSLFAPTAMAVILSPIGCSIGGGVGLFLFLKAR